MKTLHQPTLNYYSSATSTSAINKWTTNPNEL